MEKLKLNLATSKVFVLNSFFISSKFPSRILLDLFISVMYSHNSSTRIIRYSDVLLMAAEAYNRGGIDDGLAQEFLNQVRRRAFGDEKYI
jgi:hypothetical protein